MSGNLVITRSHNECVWIGDTRIKVQVPLSRDEDVRLVISDVSGEVVFFRDHNESIWIGNTCIKVQVPTQRGRQVRLVISAPKDVLILRDEIKNGSKPNKNIKTGK